ncbi:MAG: molybdenum cofactor guanylyltransferase [Kineosporiaceae bacterium]
MTARGTAATPWAAVVLAGGRSRRMGRRDKTALKLAGRSLRERVLGAVAGAEEVVVVGPEVGPSAGCDGRVVTVRENPPGGGPLAAVEAALPHVRAEVVVVLAADLPFAAGVPEALVAALDGASGADGAVPVDAGGRRQPLAAAYRTAALSETVAGARPTAGRPFRDVLTRLRVIDVPAATLPRGALVDVDTPEDWRAALWMAHRRSPGAVDDVFRGTGAP